MAKLNGCVSDNVILPETKHPNVLYGSRICLESTPIEGDFASSYIYLFLIVNFINLLYNQHL